MLLAEAWIGIYLDPGRVVYPVMLPYVQQEGIGSFFMQELKVDNRGRVLSQRWATRGVQGDIVLAYDQ